MRVVKNVRIGRFVGRGPPDGGLFPVIYCAVCVYATRISARRVRDCQGPQTTHTLPPNGNLHDRVRLRINTSNAKRGDASKYRARIFHTPAHAPEPRPKSYGQTRLGLATRGRFMSSANPYILRVIFVYNKMPSKHTGKTSARPFEFQKERGRTTCIFFRSTLVSNSLDDKTIMK